MVKIKKVIQHSKILFLTILPEKNEIELPNNIKRKGVIIARVYYPC